MMQWLNDWNKAAQATGLELMLQPANDVIDWWFDYSMWIMLQKYYAPYRLPDSISDVERWVQTVSLNGVKSSNLCHPC